MKICKGCEENKPYSEYYKHNTGKDGHRNYCKKCVYERAKKSMDVDKIREYKKQYHRKNAERLTAKTSKWREDNRDRYLQSLKEYGRQQKLKDPEATKLRARGYALKRKYGITLEQYEQLLTEQNRCCAICGKHESESTTSMAVDHDHVTGRIRGILCTHCNYRLVARHRDGSLLRKIADYVEQGTDWYVPERKKRKKSARK